MNFRNHIKDYKKKLCFYIIEYKFNTEQFQFKFVK